MNRGDITPWRRDGLVLRPSSPRARNVLDALEPGVRVLIQVHGDRNLKQMQAYFAMLNRVVAATGRWPNADALSFQISMDLKSGHPVVDRDGCLHWQADSRAVGAMAQDTFDELFRQTEEWLCREIPCELIDLRRDAA